MAYIVGLMNHFAAIQRLTSETGAQISLNAATFILEAKLRNRYFHFYPQFLTKRDGRFAQTSTITDDTIGFAGWRPYQPFTFPMAADKLQFKQYFQARGQRMPTTWLDPRQADRDFLVKRSVGSFGLQMSGPFRTAERTAFDLGPAATGAGQVFAEAFIEGTIVKVWFWGRRAFFAHRQSYPEISGDGVTSASELAQARMQLAADAWGKSPDAAVARACLRYQGHEPGAVLKAGTTAWIDYRYGRSYVKVGAIRASDDALGSFDEGARAQIDAAGFVAAQALKEIAPVPVAYAMDAMLDAEGKLWWLEMNTNPTVPPEGYVAIFGDLFA